MAGILVVTVAYATVGLLLALRPGGGRMGAILLVGSAVFAAVPFGYAFAGTMAIRNPLDPVANVLVLLGPALVPLGYALILPVVALMFPDGRLPSSRWRWPARVALGALAAASILIVFTPAEILNILPWNPIGIDALPVWVWGLAGPLGGVGAVLISVLGVAAVVTRYRRGAGVERQQLRWFVAAVAPGGGPDHRLAPWRRTRRVPPGRIRPAPRARLGLDRRHPLPPVRDRPAHQPRPVVGRHQRRCSWRSTPEPSSCSRPCSAT